MTNLSTTVMARAERMERQHAARREQIVGAAKTVFVEKGLNGATMRAIEAVAGFTTGSIYPYFESKEELYAAVLGVALADLQAHVASHIADVQDPAWAGRRALFGFFDYYRSRPDELSLGLYLYNGIGPSGLNADLDRDLNERLRSVFDLIEQAFADSGTPEADARTAAGVAHATGLLVMEQTRRLKLFKRGAEELFNDYLDLL
ncbi:MAG TPA: TetR/AcrR family transcriptional regulator [Alphaproteobacteria bacterium]|nr:TetR/AcrR family transcriptional regulator [Alphaproteobacteria bacterium]